MGYFERKLHRGRARAQREVRTDAALRERGWRPWQGEPWWPPARRTYLRFAPSELQASSGQRKGVFQAAYDLLDEDSLEPALHRQLCDSLTWFSVHLPPHQPREAAADSFFESSGEACIRRVWDLVWILNEHGRRVEFQRLENPGRIAYEDEAQVAAVPWTKLGLL